METDTETVTITVGTINRAPVFTQLAPKQATVGKNLQFRVSAKDPDGDPITYSSDPLPAGATFDPSNCRFSWTPDSTQVGTHTVTFYASDGKLTGEMAVLITVLVK